MKALLLCVIMLFLAVSSAVAGGHIGLYGDPEAVTCSVTDVPAGLLSFYVVAWVPSGATGVGFAAPQPACLAGAIYLGDIFEFYSHSGGSQIGCSVAYELTCRTDPVHAMTINYLGAGTTPACCQYPIIPHQDEPAAPIAWDCTPEGPFKILLDAGYVTVNANATCSCTVPAGRSTWGAIKAVYE